MKKRKIIYPKFIMIPHKVIIDKKLNPSARLVYGVIYWYTQLKLKKCTVFNSTIANILDISDSTVVKSLTLLERAKHIKRIFKDKGKKRREEIIPLTIMDEGKKKQPKKKLHRDEWEAVGELGADHFGVGLTEFWNSPEMKSYAIKEYRKMKSK